MDVLKYDYGKNKCEQNNSVEFHVDRASVGLHWPLPLRVLLGYRTLH